MLVTFSLFPQDSNLSRLTLCKLFETLRAHACELVALLVQAYKLRDIFLLNVSLMCLSWCFFCRLPAGPRNDDVLYLIEFLSCYCEIRRCEQYNAHCISTIIISW